MNTPVFKKDFFINNRAKLRELFLGTAPIIITANGLLQKNGGESLGFAQDSNFWYLTGIDHPDIILVIDKQKEYLILPEHSDIHDYFDGELVSDELTEISGIELCYSELEGWKQLKSKLKKTKHFATLAPPPSFIKSYGMYTNPSRKNLIKKIKVINPDIELLDLRAHLMNMRVVKTDEEIQAIKSAIDITVNTLKPIMKPNKLDKYSFEYEIEADISSGIRSRGAFGHAFDPIVGSGLNSTIIHSTTNNSVISKNLPIVIDVGARFNNYCADITRTVVPGKVSARIRLVYEAVVAAQEHALSMLKPGLILSEYELEMEHYIGEKLRELGLIKIIDKANVRKYFPHLVSHYLGIDVHDVGDYSMPLVKNMVITCEPGIYIPEESIGVRLEDDVLITDDGNIVLSERLPRGL
ncbi:MAG: aminopeptidase P N-terminal domain-containing protein [bacterium]